jgi:hypothetical protein
VHHAISLQLHHGRSVVALLVDPWTLDRLLAFDAEVTDLEDADGEPAPDQEIDGPGTVSDIVPPRRCCRPSRVAQALALGLFLVTVPYTIARADPAPTITLPLSTSEAPTQCCRICRKGQPCGDACISSTEQVQEGAGLRVPGRQRVVSLPPSVQRRRLPVPVPVKTVHVA